MKILSEDNESITYLEIIKKTPYLIKVSKNGEILEMQEYNSDKRVVDISQNKRNIEFG